MTESSPFGEALSSGPAVEHIKERILDGTFPPGSFLSAKAIAKTLGMSRSPIRDALRMLESEGLVRFTPHLGAAVIKLSEEEISDLIGLRRIMEAYCAALAAQRRTIHELEKLQALLEEMEALSPVAPTVTHAVWRKEMAERDALFHWTIIRATKNNYLIKEVEQSRTLLTIHFSGPLTESPLPELHAAINQNHRVIYEAIQAQDPLAARRAMEGHLSVGSSIPVL